MSLLENIDVSRVLGSAIANTFQWVVIGVLFFVARAQGKALSGLSEGNRTLEEALYALFRQVGALGEADRDDCKALLRELTNDINRDQIKEFGTPDADAALERIDSFWNKHRDKLREIPRCESLFLSFRQETKAFVDELAAPTAFKASPKRKAVFVRVKPAWRSFFEIAFAHMKLSKDEEAKFDKLAIGYPYIGTVQQFVAQFFGLRGDMRQLDF